MVSRSTLETCDACISSFLRLGGEKGDLVHKCMHASLKTLYKKGRRNGRRGVDALHAKQDESELKGILTDLTNVSVFSSSGVP